MKDFFKRPQMIMEASAMSRGHKLWAEILIFLGALFVAIMSQSMVLLNGIIFLYFFNSDFLELILSAENLSDSEINGKLLGIAEKLMRSDSFMLILLLSSVVMLAVGFVYCYYIEKRSVRSMGFVKKGFLREYMYGLLIGSVLIALPILICVLSGSMTLKYVPGFNLFAIFMFFIAFMLQGMSEEIFFRGYFMVSVSRRYSLPVAILLSSILFSLGHVFNEGIEVMGLINIALFGIFAGIYIIKRGSIWGAGAIHSAWNFVQGNIFGLSVSGTNTTSSVFSTQETGEGILIKGSDFGLEGELVVTIVLLAAILIISLVKNKKSRADYQSLVN